MISYFVIQAPLTVYFISNDDIANLLDLIRLRRRTARLQTQDFINAGLAEDVMVPANSFREALAGQQCPQVLEIRWHLTPR